MFSDTAVADIVQADKYPIIKLITGELDLEILNVREIIGGPEVPKVPQVPPHIRRAIKLRDKALTVVYQCLKLDLKATPETERSCIIVFQIIHSVDKVRRFYVRCREARNGQNGIEE